MVASWEYLEQILTVTVTVSCPSNICPGDICPYQEYLGFYWPDFDETLKVASRDPLEQIPSIKLAFVQVTFTLVTFVHIRNILAVTDSILSKLWRKVRKKIIDLNLLEADIFT